MPTFGEITDALIAAKESAWRNEKHRWQWRHTLSVYAKALWDKPVDKIETADVLAVLKPLWQAKAETASRLRGRIEAVLDAAKAQGHRQGESGGMARTFGPSAAEAPKTHPRPPRVAALCRSAVLY